MADLFLFDSCADDTVTVHESSSLLIFYPAVHLHDEAFIIFYISFVCDTVATQFSCLCYILFHNILFNLVAAG